LTYSSALAEKILKSLESKLHITNINGTTNLVIAIAGYRGTVNVNAHNASVIGDGKVSIVKSVIQHDSRKDKEKPKDSNLKDSDVKLGDKIESIIKEEILTNNNDENKTNESSPKIGSTL